jgi:hypothetical protein
MNAKQKNTMLIAAIVSGIISLPLPWMSIHNAVFQNPFGGSLTLPLPLPTQIDLTGINGKVTFLITSPIWLVVCIAMAGSALQFMRQSKMFEIPNFVVWGAAIFALIWSSVPVLVALFSGNASLGIGWLFGLFCAAAPLACLMLRTRGGAVPSKSDGPNPASASI